MTKPNGITLFIPVFNEEDILENHIRYLWSHMKGLSFPFEIIVVSNGSFDQTVPILRTLANELSELRVFDLPQKGVGSAFVVGTKKARYECMISLDMDLSIDLAFIETSFYLLSHVHIVVGSKQTGGQQRSLVRVLASNAFIYCAKILLGISYSDYSIAAKAYRPKAIFPYLSMLDNHTFYVVMILFKAYHDKSRIMEIPVTCRDLRASRFNLFHEGIYKFSRTFLLCAKERLIPSISIKIRWLKSN